MFKNIIVAVFIFIFLFSSGCGWLGRTAGKAQAKIERKTEAVIDGYKEGYANEKQKTSN